MSDPPVLERTSTGAAAGKAMEVGQQQRGSISESTDSDLMDAAKVGDRAAFGLLVRRHQQRILRVASHLLRDTNEAEDVMQETFIRAYRAIERFDGRSQPYTWFYRIAVNLSLNRLRSRKRHSRQRSVDDPLLEPALVDPSPQASPQVIVSGKQLAINLADALDALSETLRTTLILVVLDGLAHSDVAAILGCPEGTVAWRVHEARRKLRTVLEGQGHLEGDECR